MINVPGNTLVPDPPRDTQINVLPDGQVFFGFATPLELSQANTELNLLGGTVTADTNAYGGATLNLISGSFAGDLDLYPGSQANVAGAAVERIDTNGGGTATLTSGTIDRVNLDDGGRLEVGGGLASYVAFDRGGSVAVSGGRLRELADIEQNASLVVTGGVIGTGDSRTIDIEDGGSAEFNGGVVLSTVVVDGEATFSGGVFDNVVGRTDSSVTFQGAEFYRNGIPLTSLDTPGETLTTSLFEGQTITGVLADGTPFALADNDGDSFDGVAPWDRTLTLEFVPVAPAIPGEFLASASPNVVGVRNGQTVRVDAGAALSPNFTAGRGSRVIVEVGGTTSDNFEAIGSEVIIDGGDVGERFGVFEDTHVDLRAGTIGEYAAVHGGNLTLSGGLAA
ncbi:MAG: hypothetical protein AAF266_14865, partial [Planctomycetota bacterium]